MKHWPMAFLLIVSAGILSAGDSINNGRDLPIVAGIKSVYQELPFVLPVLIAHPSLSPEAKTILESIHSSLDEEYRAGAPKFLAGRDDLFTKDGKTYYGATLPRVGTPIYFSRSMLAGTHGQSLGHYVPDEHALWLLVELLARHHGVEQADLASLAREIATADGVSIPTELLVRSSINLAENLSP